MIRVDAHPNGGVTVVGTDGNQIQLKAMIQDWDRTDERARDIGEAVRLFLEGTAVGGRGAQDHQPGELVGELRAPRSPKLGPL